MEHWEFQYEKPQTCLQVQAQQQYRGLELNAEHAVKTTTTLSKLVVLVAEDLLQEEFNPAVSAPAHVAAVVSRAHALSRLKSLSVAKHLEEQNLLDSLRESVEPMQNAIASTSRSSSPTWQPSKRPWHAVGSEILGMAIMLEAAHDQMGKPMYLPMCPQAIRVLPTEMELHVEVPVNFHWHSDGHSGASPTWTGTPCSMTSSRSTPSTVTTA